MDVSKYKNMTEEIVLKPMIDFIEEWEEDDYTKDDVKKCESLIYAYLDNLGAMNEPTDEEIMEQVKLLVLALNDLNEATDCVLIETEQREAIWQVIQYSAVECGLKDASEDITEEWREW